MFELKAIPTPHTLLFTAAATIPALRVPCLKIYSKRNASIIKTSSSRDNNASSPLVVRKWWRRSTCWSLRSHRRGCSYIEDLGRRHRQQSRRKHCHRSCSLTPDAKSPSHRRECSPRHLVPYSLEQHHGFILVVSPPFLSSIPILTKLDEIGWVGRSF